VGDQSTPAKLTECPTVAGAHMIGTTQLETLAKSSQNQLLLLRVVG